MKKLITPEKAIQLANDGQYAKLKKLYISQNFSWGEVFVHCSDADISNALTSVFHNAQKQALTMETVRALFGDKIIDVSSWYRSKWRNNAVGGAKFSQHRYGLATDFVIRGYSGYTGNKKVQLILDPLPFMQVRGLEFTGGNWTHVDTRGRKARFNR